ncbi:MAG: Uma2 family endonuclease [Cytophagaceae bacterium]|nr:MAG: Uma2 family endonuclease [Cytophagaceae bacterium]
MIAIAQQIEPLPDSLNTVDEFEAWQRLHVKEGSYEFVRGRIIPKPAMKQDEVFIADFLLRLFTHTAAYSNGDSLLPETDSYVDGFRKRIPDITYLTAEQKQAIRRGERVKTLFAIEILSESESFEDVTDKIQDYFDAGAQLVWYIAPRQRRIYAYTSATESIVYKDNMPISASPLLPDFQFATDELFA